MLRFREPGRLRHTVVTLNFAAVVCNGSEVQSMRRGCVSTAIDKVSSLIESNNAFLISTSLKQSIPLGLGDH